MLQRISGAMGGKPIDFAPSGIIKEVSQNVRTLLMTAKYSVPLDRELGIDASFLDRPAPEAMARLRVQIAQEIRRFEPRAAVKAVEFKEYNGEALAGAFYPVARIEIIGG